MGTILVPVVYNLAASSTEVLQELIGLGMAADLKWLGLSESKVNETLKNSSLTKQLCGIVVLAREALREKGEDTLSGKGTVIVAF